jgi:hypothetical protein
VPMNDDAPDHSLPIFLSGDGDEAATQRSSHTRIAGLAIAAALTISAAVLALAHPVARLAAVSSLFVGASAPEPDQDRAAPPSVVESEVPTDQSTTAVATTAATTTAAAAEPAAVDPAPQAPADQQQAETKDRAQDRAKDRAASDALFVQFQAWAQKQNSGPEPQQDQAHQDQDQASPAQVTQDAPAVPKPSAESTQGGPTRIEPAAAAPVRAAQKRRAVREPQNARAEMEAARRTQAKLSHPHGAPTRAVEDVNTQETPAPPSQPPSLLQIFGWR